jgi:hypothetical protein
LVTSKLPLLEVLVVPYRAGNRALANRYEALLTRLTARGMKRWKTASSAMREEPA